MAMQLKKNEPDNSFLIRGYGDTTFRVAGKVQDGAVLVAARYAEPAPVAQFEDLDVDAIKAIEAALGPVDVLLIGTGKTMKLLPSKLRAAFQDRSIPVDVMDTGAAARTYNVLVTEDRQAACLLFPNNS